MRQKNFNKVMLMAILRGIPSRIILLWLALCLSACGNKGPLYLPAAAGDDKTASQVSTDPEPAVLAVPEQTQAQPDEAAKRRRHTEINTDNK